MRSPSGSLHNKLQIYYAVAGNHFVRMFQYKKEVHFK